MHVSDDVSPLYKPLQSQKNDILDSVNHKTINFNQNYKMILWSRDRLTFWCMSYMNHNFQIIFWHMKVNSPVFSLSVISLDDGGGFV